jgi:cholest-4-en-3-one 26-monooxygenase
MTDKPDIDLLDNDAFATDEPDRWFRWLRQNDPVYWHDEPDAPGFWVLTKHADVVAVNRDAVHFSSDQKYGGVIPFEEAKLAETNTFADGISNMLTMDAPDHTRYRRLVSRGFTPRAMAAVEERLRQVAAGLIDDALAQGTCDWVDTVSGWLPITAITELVGVSADDRRRVFEWANRLTGSTDPEYGGSFDALVTAAIEVFTFGTELQAERRLHPGTDVLSTLLLADIDGEALDEMEVNMFLILLLTAGSETTRNAMTNSLIVLMEQPQLYRELAEDRSLIPTAVDEMLRWATPVPYMRRTAITDVEIRGRTIKAGDKVTIWYPSANRDEEVFDDPYRFDIRRDPNPHVTFGGGGPHFCMGSNLARMEMRVLYDALFDRVQDCRLAGSPERLRSNMVNGVKHLPVELVPIT